MITQTKRRTLTRFRTILVTLSLVLMGVTGATGVASANGGYPDSDAVACGSSAWCKNGSWYSGRGYAYRNCTDYVAWKLQSLGVSDAKTRGLGNGGQWAANASGRAGVTVNGAPAYGAAAVMPSTSGNPYGHVAFVEAVHSNGTITISEYNYGWNGNHHMRTATAASMGFSQFVHFGVSSAPPSTGLVSSSKTSSSDVDKNSAADLVLTTDQPRGGSAASVLLSTWDNLIAPQQWWDDPTVGWNGIKPLVGDVNGDKKADYTFIANSGMGVRAYVALSTGSSFSAPQLWWNGDTYGYQGSKVLMGDVDGNGAADVVYVRSDGGNGTIVNVALSTWQGFLPPQQWWSEPNYTFTKVNPMLGDFKITIDPVTHLPDGAVDLMLVTNQEGAGTWAMALISSRSSFITPALWWSEASYAFSDVKPSMGDVDGNGAADLVLTHKLSGGGTEVMVALSTWDGFIAMTRWWNAPGYGWSGVTPLVGDVKFTYSQVNGQPDKAADLVILTDEGSNGTKAFVAVSSRSSFVGSELLWHGGGWGYGGVKASLG